MKKEAIKLRTIFMGTSTFASQILEALARANYNIIAAYTQPDRKAGREQEAQKTPVRVIAEKFQIPVFTPEKLTAEEIRQLKNLKPDLIVVAAYGRILPKEILEAPGFGAVNVHTSLLPKFRGPSPIQNAILLGEKETGGTIMLMDEGIDTGDILAQKSLAIGKDEPYLELTERLADLSIALLLETLPLWVAGEIQPRRQDSSSATLCQIIERSDGRIFWSDEAQEIYNKYRAFTPWPGIFSYWAQSGEPKRIKLNRIGLSESEPDPKLHLGEVFQTADYVGVQTAVGIIRLEEVQLEGKSNMQIKDFLNGYPDIIGSILK